MLIGIVLSIWKYNVYGYEVGGVLRASDIDSRDLDFPKSSELGFPMIEKHIRHFCAMVR